MPNTILSQRARDVASASNNLMWDIMRNPWCPTTKPNGYVNVGVAENALMHDYLLDYINTELDLPAKYLTYNDGGIGSERLRRAVAGFLNKHLQPIQPITGDDVVITNGVSAAIEHVSWAFTDPGEGILLGRPYYGTFIPDMSLRPGAVVVPVEFGDCDPFSLPAVDRYEAALLEFQQKTGRKVRALMLCHPHNPLGRCYPRSTLVQLMRLCQKYHIHLISDEIYALSVWENTVDPQPAAVAFESALSINTSRLIDPSLVHVLWGMSKDFGANGLRIGAIVSQNNPALHLALKGASLYSYPSSVSEHLASLVLEDTFFTRRYIQLNQQKLSESYAFAVQHLRSQGIEYAPGAHAAFFLWVNLGLKYRKLHPVETAQMDGDAIAEKVMELLLRRKVFLATGALFGSECGGWFRIVFSHRREYLEEALWRIVLALNDV
ncbi:PLP-dependent transferase [Aspergillus heteromorphus CBS 117.55]|uniref:PLP-dependent transferase n=1 Tax=Aspergillus heteromorphus CBS 117.55 TaxID=1448321 RepID=A0A317X0V4_9EURO|nr:PLP-dependent transferase [Aspergillus heteromorphus CBS 117.55]PWY92226.1 PLP-dependent transferase [Aspergillus heteromorphus CBS 117.55]